jgi:CHAT domain-containing protein
MSGNPTCDEDLVRRLAQEGAATPDREDEVLAVMRAHDRRGAYAAAAAYADTLPASLRTLPAVSLARARNRMRQGRMADAGAALAEANLVTATAGERLVLALESASLLTYQAVAIRESLAAAAAAFAAAAGADVHPADLAEAERVRIRIQLAAAVYFEIKPEERRRARDRLPELADVLAQAGRTDEALAAQLTYAEQLEDADAKLHALAALADRARAADRPGVAGEAYVARAALLLATGASSAAIRAELDTASELFPAAGHVYGPIDVRRARGRLAVEREFAATDELEACLEAYRRLDYPRGAISVLLDLSQLAHERGDTANASVYRRQCLELTEAVGMGLARDSILMAQIDLLMRAHDHGGAIELCQAALAAAPPAFMAAGYEQLLSSAYAFVDNHAAAVFHGRRALDGYTDIGAIDSASDVALKLANDLAATHRDDDFGKASDLLGEWLDQDMRRGRFAAAVSKRELLAQITLNQFFYSPRRHGDPSLLLTAEQTLDGAEEVARKLPGLEAARRLGALYQLRGQLAQARGESQAVEQAWRDALEVYERAGLAFEAANCRYIIGALRLNRANETPMPHFGEQFGEAESNLRAALEYYAQSGMRQQAADTRFMLAQLYVNASPRVPRPLGEQLLEAAKGHLADAEADYDALRGEFAAGPVLAWQLAKRTFTKRSSRVYDLLLQMHVERGNAREAWRWCQRGKARALADALGASAVPLPQVHAQLAKHPQSLGLVVQERELVERKSKAPAGKRLALEAELQQLRQRMAQDPLLAEYLELRTGAAVDLEGLKKLLAPDLAAGLSCVCVDWVEVKDRLVLLALRVGSEPEMVRLAATATQVRESALSLLGEQAFRQTLHDAPELLREFDPLVAPLADLSRPEELLILAPTGPLHALPLHALEVGGKPLLTRNPVVYCPSLSVLRYCLARRKINPGLHTAALFGDPTGDRDEAAELVERVARNFGTAALTKDKVTRGAFASSVGNCDLIHFQGHAKHDRDEPLDSYLRMADGEFRARDIFSLGELRAELVVLAACESAANVIATGDEPLGLIPAFLYAGAGAVLAALWPVCRRSAAQAMRFFYDAIAVTGGAVEKAQALRAALLALADNPEFNTPYRWAPFVLYGDWR